MNNINELLHLLENDTFYLSDERIAEIETLVKKAKCTENRHNKIWIKSYVKLLAKVGSVFLQNRYVNKDRIDKASVYYIERMTLLQSLYEKDKAYWGKDFAKSLLDMAFFKDELNLKSGVRYIDEAYPVWQGILENANKKDLEDYFHFLQHSSRMCACAKQFDKARMLLKEAKACLEKHDFEKSHQYKIMIEKLAASYSEKFD